MVKIIKNAVNNFYVDVRYVTRFIRFIFYSLHLIGRYLLRNTGSECTCWKLKRTKEPSWSIFCTFNAGTPCAKLMYQAIVRRSPLLPTVLRLSLHRVNEITCV